MMRAHFGLPSVKTGERLLFYSPLLGPFTLPVSQAFADPLCSFFPLPFRQTKPPSAYPSPSSSRSPTSPSPESRSATSRSWRNRGTRLCLGCGLVASSRSSFPLLLPLPLSSLLTTTLFASSSQYITQHGDDYSLRTVGSKPLAFLSLSPPFPSSFILLADLTLPIPPAHRLETVVHHHAALASPPDSSPSSPCFVSFSFFVSDLRSPTYLLLAPFLFTLQTMDGRMHLLLRASAYKE